MSSHFRHLSLKVLSILENFFFFFSLNLIFIYLKLLACVNFYFPRHCVIIQMLISRTCGLQLLAERQQVTYSS